MFTVVFFIALGTYVLTVANQVFIFCTDSKYAFVRKFIYFMISLESLAYLALVVAFAVALAEMGSVDLSLLAYARDNQCSD